jgi:hypothetical protein
LEIGPPRRTPLLLLNLSQKINPEHISTEYVQTKLRSDFTLIGVKIIKKDQIFKGLGLIKRSVKVRGA